MKMKVKIYGCDYVEDWCDGMMLFSTSACFGSPEERMNYLKTEDCSDDEIDIDESDEGTTGWHFWEDEIEVEIPEQTKKND